MSATAILLLSFAIPAMFIAILHMVRRVHQVDDFRQRALAAQKQLTPPTTADLLDLCITCGALRRRGEMAWVDDDYMCKQCRDIIEPPENLTVAAAELMLNPAQPVIDLAKMDKQGRPVYGVTDDPNYEWDGHEYRERKLMLEKIDNTLKQLEGIGVPVQPVDDLEKYQKYYRSQRRAFTQTQINITDSIVNIYQTPPAFFGPNPPPRIPVAGRYDPRTGRQVITYNDGTEDHVRRRVCDHPKVVSWGGELVRDGLCRECYDAQR